MGSCREVLTMLEKRLRALETLKQVRKLLEESYAFRGEVVERYHDLYSAVEDRVKTALMVAFEGGCLEPKNEG